MIESIILSIIFIILKSWDIISWSWLWVLSPMWIFFMCSVLLFMIYIIIYFIVHFIWLNKRDYSKTLDILLDLLDYLGIGLVLLFGLTSIVIKSLYNHINRKKIEEERRLDIAACTFYDCSKGGTRAARILRREIGRTIVENLRK